MNEATKSVCNLIFICMTTVTFMLIWVECPRKILRCEMKSNNANISKMNIYKAGHDDPILVDILRKDYIQPPSVLPYNISLSGLTNPSPGQAQFIDESLNYMREGFFVDCGAFDGEHLSNSLFLERYRSWTGILIEPNPNIYQDLVNKQRKAYTLNACLSTKTYPSVETIFLTKNPFTAKVVDAAYTEKHSTKKYAKVQCFPLYTILLAIGRLDVDYFSLDVEGAERGVLDSIPWTKLNIKSISIEHNKWEGGKQDLKHYMENRGYTLMTTIKVNVAPDLIFMKTK